MNWEQREQKRKKERKKEKSEKIEAAMEKSYVHGFGSKDKGHTVAAHNWRKETKSQRLSVGLNKNIYSIQRVAPKNRRCLIES